MSLSTYQRMHQSNRDYIANRMKKIDAAYAAAGLTAECGGYPIGPDQTTAYNAGFQRGCRWVWADSAVFGKKVAERWDFADGSYGGQGEQDGWNTAVKVVNDSI